MQNITMEVKGDTLTISVNLKGDMGASKSGKTRIIASTQGNTAVPGKDGVKIGINVYAVTR